MATSWPEKRRLIGKKHARLDGPAKSTGRAKYTYDINRPGMLHAIMVRCPHAHARVKKIDTSAAEKVGGFKALHKVVKEGDELFYAGEEVLAVCADTEEHAQDAARAIKIEYEVLPFLVKEDDARKADSAETAPPFGPRKDRNNILPPMEGKSATFDEGLKEADAVVEGTYGMSTICHQCLEPHGLVAEWDSDGGLTVWASTQAVAGTAQQLSAYFMNKGLDLPQSKVRCITHYMGGGFGSKFGPDIQGQVAAELALVTKKPVKLMLDRADEIIAAGNRPSAYGKVKIAGTKDGKVTAYEVDSWGTPGVGRGATVNFGVLPYVYSIAFNKKHQIVRLNAGALRAMRAPGHPQNCFLTDCPLDDLAAKLGLDPLEVRLKNLPENDEDAVKNAPTSFAALRGTIYRRELEIAARESGWKEKWHPPGKGPSKGPWKHGIGMALHTWGGQASPRPNECTILIAADGSVTVQSSTQDLGTAQRTVSAIVAAEILGLQPEQITVQIGESQWGESSGSGGSTTCPSQAPATLRAATAALQDLFTKIAPRLNAKAADLSVADGKVVDKASNKSYDWKQACSRLGMQQAKGKGEWTFAMSEEEDNKGVSSSGVGGVQVAEVWVDSETGQVRCSEILAVQDCGMIVNLLGCESQVAGGIIMGANLALYEERIMDRTTGRQVNPDMEFYKLGGIGDIPRIKVVMVDMPERGVIGIGEPPTISTHAAIGNAIHNALGVRVPETPFTPDRVLAALARGGSQ